MKTTFQELEFDKVKEIIKQNCFSTLGKDIVDKLCPLENKQVIEEKLSVLEDTKNYLLAGNNLNLFALNDVFPLLQKLSIENYVLNIEEHLTIYNNIKISNRIKQDFRNENEHYPFLSKIIKKIKYCYNLSDEYDATFDEKNEIRDDASSQLRRIRQQIKNTKENLHTHLQSILTDKRNEHLIQDNIITIRDGRYVIPIKERKQNAFAGIIHGISSSKATVFMEPLAVVNLNNKLNNLYNEEKSEIFRILGILTNKVREITNELKTNLKVLQQLDYLQACAVFSKSISATHCEITDLPIISLHNAYHPLLYISTQSNKEKIVPFSLDLNENKNVLIISGVNTGGKTVTLKTVGLLSVMALSGLLIPATSDSKIGLFKHIYSDIGDEQSIENALSTFSSHITKIKNMIENADERTLLLIDELGIGTDPEEGAALAQAIIEHIIQTRAKLITTTHFTKLKVFANDNYLCMNSSMRFDTEKLVPTYNLDIGLPGNSYALEIAKKYGLNQKIIDRANEIVGKQNLNLTNLLSTIEQEKRELEDKIKYFEQEHNKLEKEKIELENKLKNWKKEEREIKRASLEKAQFWLNSLQQEFTQEIKSLREEFKNKKQIEQIKVHKILHHFSEQRNKIHQKEEKLSELKLVHLTNPQVKDAVWVKSLGAKGIIVKISKTGKVNVNVNGMLIFCRKSDLFQLPDGVKIDKKKRAVVRFPYVDDKFGMDLDVHGLNFDEARPRINKYIDNALLLDLEQVRIVHGKGTGLLRQKIHQYFRSDKRIKEISYAPMNEGGTGVTIVKIK